jgi:hypothetical protein
MRIGECGQKPTPTRLLEMLSDRFGALEDHVCHHHRGDSPKAVDVNALLPVD